MFQKRHGFVLNPCNACAMNKIIDGKQIALGFHVDDLLITCTDNLLLDNVIKCLQSEFREVKEKRDDDIIGYLGIRIESKEDG